MKRLSVLITSSYYWPEGAGTAPYLTGLAEYLSDRGHTVVVAPRSRTIGNGARRRTGASARPRIGASSSGAAPTSSRDVSRPHSRRCMRRRSSEVGSPPSIFGSVRTSSWAPVRASQAGRSRARGGGGARIPYGLIFQDLMGLAARQSGVAGGDRVASAVRRAELRLARRAERIAIIAEGSVGISRTAASSPGGSIDGGTGPANPARGNRGGDATTPRMEAGRNSSACTAGTWVRSRASAISLRRPSALPTRGSGSCSRATETTGPASRTRCGGGASERSSSSRCSPPAAGRRRCRRPTCWSLAQRASVADMSLPSKLTSYFASGRPLWRRCPLIAETAREIREAGAGYVVPPEDPVALRDTIVALSEDPAVASALGDQARVYADTRLSAEASLEQHEEFVSAVASRTTRT